MEHACCFAGHRPDKLPFGGREDHPGCVALRERLAGEIAAMRERGVTEFLSGMARGTDLWAAEAVLELRARDPAVRLTAVLPFAEYGARWPEAQRLRYRAVLREADSRVVVSPVYTRRCMLERNRYLVEHAGHLIAVYGGTPGGTAYTLAYARALGRDVVVLRPEG